MHILDTIRDLRLITCYAHEIFLPQARRCKVIYSSHRAFLVELHHCHVHNVITSSPNRTCIFRSLKTTWFGVCWNATLRIDFSRDKKLGELLTMEVVTVVVGPCLGTGLSSAMPCLPLPSAACLMDCAKQPNCSWLASHFEPPWVMKAGTAAWIPSFQTDWQESIPTWSNFLLPCQQKCSDGSSHANSRLHSRL